MEHRNDGLTGYPVDRSVAIEHRLARARRRVDRARRRLERRERELSALMGHGHPRVGARRAS